MNSTFEQPKESSWHSLPPSALSSLQLLAVVLLVTSVSLLPGCWSATIGLYKIIASFTFTGERVKSETLCIRMSVCAGPCGQGQGKKGCVEVQTFFVLLCAGEPKEKSKGKM